MNQAQYPLAQCPHKQCPRCARLVGFILSVSMALAALSAPASARVDDRARQILERASLVMAAANTVSYDFSYRGIGSAAASLSGNMLHQPPNRGRDHRFLARLEISQSPPQLGQEAAVLHLAHDGERYWRHRVGEPTASTGQAANGASYLGLGYFWAAIPQMLRGAEPLGVELETAIEIAWAGTDQVGNTLCDVVFLRFPSDTGLGDQYLSFGREDGFLRHIELYGSGEPLYGFDLAIDNLNVHEDLPAEQFRWSPPSGVELVNVDDLDLEAGAFSPSWSLTSTTGETVSIEDFRGRVVVLDFWATWCPFCAASAPGLSRLSEHYSEQPVQFLGLNLWETSDPGPWIEQHAIPYPVLLEAGPVADLYKVGATPFTIVLDRQGKIAHVERGGEASVRVANVRAAIERALGTGRDSSASR